MMYRCTLLLLTFCACNDGDVSATTGALPSCGDPWPVHTISDLVPRADGTAVVDLDLDGRPDLLEIHEGDLLPATAHFHPGFSAHLYRQWPSMRVGLPIQAGEGVIAGDLDADGWPDAVLLPQQEGALGGIQVAFSRGGAMSWETIVLPGSDVGRWLGGVIADFTGDGCPDIMTAPATAAVNLYEHPCECGDATDPFAWTQQAGIFQARHVMQLFADDVDGDGDLDAIVAQRRENASTPPPSLWWAENGAGWARHPISPDDRVSGIACRGDIDADGDDDVVLPTISSVDPLYWYERTGDPDVWAEHSWPRPPLATGEWKGCAIGDVTGDGEQDVVVTLGSSVHNVWLIDGDGWTWTPLDEQGHLHKLEEPILMDVDGNGDGDLDVILAEEDAVPGGRGVLWLENPGPGCTP